MIKQTDGTGLVKQKVFLITNGDDIKMPSMNGWSRNDVVRFCNLIGIHYNINGSGYVVAQNVGEGDNIPDSIDVSLENKE